MPAARFFYPAELTNAQEISIEGKEFHHLKNVMRTEQGDHVDVVNGAGQLAKGTVRAIKKQRAHISIKETVDQQRGQNPHILAQALPRMNRLDTIVEKGTELGMTELWLFPGDNSEKGVISEGQLERLRGITISALKQCGRLFLPKIVIKPPISQWEALPYPLFFGDTREGAAQMGSIREGAVVVIGPESGFSGGEVQSLEKLGGVGVKLHENILRTDTAAIVALYSLTADHERTV